MGPYRVNGQMTIMMALQKLQGGNPSRRFRYKYPESLDPIGNRTGLTSF